jgi:hypothetical protein
MADFAKDLPFRGRLSRIIFLCSWKEERGAIERTEVSGGACGGLRRAEPSNNILLIFRFILLFTPGDATILVSDRIQTIAVGGERNVLKESTV